MDAQPATESRLPSDRGGPWSGSRDPFLGSLCRQLDLPWFGDHASLPSLDPHQLESELRTSVPCVTLSWAQSLDGAITRRRGTQTLISGPDAGVLTHVVRATHDAIVVGSGTMCSDDPQLDVRHWNGPNPRPVILDARLRTPLKARVLAPRPDRAAALVVTSSTAARELPGRVEALERCGAELLPVPLDSVGRLSPDAVLRGLAERGLESVMVEGGGSVLRSFLAARCPTRLLITVAEHELPGYRPLADEAASLAAAGRGMSGCWYRSGRDAVLAAAGAAC